MPGHDSKLHTWQPFELLEPEASAAPRSLLGRLGRFLVYRRCPRLLWMVFGFLLVSIVATVMTLSFPAGGVQHYCSQAIDTRWTSRPEVSHILTNELVWSPDSTSVVFDTRSNGFNGDAIGLASKPQTSKGSAALIVYQAEIDPSSPRCGVSLRMAGRHSHKAVFIMGPGKTEPSWPYSFWHRRGVLIDVERPGEPAQALDARDVVEPYTAGALRGGTHVHKSSGDGLLVASTYEDAVLAESPQHQKLNLRMVAVTVVDWPVAVPSSDPHNVNGSFTVAVTRLHDNPQPGSDQIQKAHDHAWVGVGGYIRANGRLQRHSLAFIGDVTGEDGTVKGELFVVDLPDSLEELRLPVPGESLQGTAASRPAPPSTVHQRRLTRLATGVASHPRHWPASSRDGAWVAFLAEDQHGVVQLWIADPSGVQEARQLTSNAFGVSSAFTWSPDGLWIAHAMDGSMCVTSTVSKRTFKLTPKYISEEMEVRSEAAVFSPDGLTIAYMRGRTSPQVWGLNVSNIYAPGWGEAFCQPAQVTDAYA